MISSSSSPKRSRAPELHAYDVLRASLIGDMRSMRDCWTVTDKKVGAVCIGRFRSASWRTSRSSRIAPDLAVEQHADANDRWPMCVHLHHTGTIAPLRRRCNPSFWL